MIKLTVHAKQRFNQRFKINPKDALTVCLEALENGVDVLHEDLFKEEMRRNAEKHDNDAVYRWKNYLVFFKENRVTTVWPLEWLRS